MSCRSLFVLLSFFSFGKYVVCPSSIYRFWFPLWYLQTLLIASNYHITSHWIERIVDGDLTISSHTPREPTVCMFSHTINNRILIIKKQVFDLALAVVDLNPNVYCRYWGGIILHNYHHGNDENISWSTNLLIKCELLAFCEYQLKESV
jgi:hypothetical protein